MHTLRIHIRNRCACWAYMSETYKHHEHTHQFLTRMLSMRISFPIFQMVILYTLSICVRNWCVHWVYASGTDVCAEHTCQKLVCALSICVMYSCVVWTHVWNLKRSLQNMLSIRVRNWCVPWAFAEGTDTFTDHINQELMRTLNICISFLHIYSA